MNALVDRCVSSSKLLSSSALKNLLLAASILVATVTGRAQARTEFEPTAYIYSGTGVCPDGCLDAVVTLARRNGLRVVLVTETALLVDPIQPRVGDIWIQPGGDAIHMSHAMGAQGLGRIRNWISKGVNYLGFCAGAFLADRTVDDSETVSGLGLIPFSTADFMPGDTRAKVLRNVWRGTPRWIYFQEGATFVVRPSATVRVIATYADQRPSVIETRFQQGKVILSGAHPEAPADWAEEERLNDPDGSDQDLADELLGLVTSASSSFLRP